jgi:hypothetical protein
MKTSLRAGLLYFVVVFAFGFALGAIRSLWVAHLTDELTAVLLELPLMLAISWIACGKVIRLTKLPGGLGRSMMMGASALALLLAAEAGLATLGFGKTLHEHLANYRAAPNVIGLLGQMAFGAFPIARMRS